MYFFCSQTTAAINQIEKSTQRYLNFIFCEISEYVNFFLSENVFVFFPSQKKLLVSTNFVNARGCMRMLSIKNYGEIHVSSSNLVPDIKSYALTLT